MKIAIDGPSASGKSTVARIVAERLGFLYLDTGAMYRTVAAVALRCGADPASEKSVLEAMDAVLTETGELPLIPDCELRSAEVSAVVSDVSSHIGVREKLVRMQRVAADSADIVMDGRDIGSVVLPNAELKIYLDASAEIRAERRAAQSGGNYEEILAAIRERDHKDMTKPVGALLQTPDAHLIDSSDMTIDEVVNKIVDLASKIALTY